MRDPRQVAVVGVTGYTGLELAGILLRHPAVASTTFYVRETRGANCIAELFPQFRGWGQAPLRSLSLDAITSSHAGTAFLATPHEVSAELAPSLLEAGLRVIDLSGAFRFRSAETFSSWYKLPAPHAPRLGEAVYGLPELPLTRLAGAKLIANPGCYATSVILALRPLADAGVIAPDQNVVCDCKSGASGAGKDPRRDLHFVEVDENFKAYNLFSHRHTPEILEHTGLAESQLIFSTHLLPLARGILSTIYVTLSAQQSPDAIEALYRKFYAGRPMVRLWPAGTLPELQHVAHTNFCDIGFALDKSGQRLIVVSCLEDQPTMRALARQVATLAQEGHEILVVHGGGRAFTEALKRMGIESKFVSGLRVTDRETRDAAVMVFAGLLNKRLAAAISSEGYPAIGVSAADAQCFLAEPMSVGEVAGSLGFVGYLTGMNIAFIESLWRERLIPVAPCLGL